MAAALIFRSTLLNQCGTVLRSTQSSSARKLCWSAAANKNIKAFSAQKAITQPSRYFAQSAPKAAEHHGQHTALWTAERALSLGLLGVIPAAIAFPSQGLDALLAVSIVMHQHWGLEAIITDYVRPLLFGNVIPKVAHGMLLLLSIATLGGLFYFIYNDIGIAKSIRKLWSVKGQ